MRVLLINPPYPFEESPTPPFGLISLAAYLLEQGVEVRIEDYIVQPYGRERIRAVLEEYRPRVVGSTAVTMNVKAALRILGEYKEEDPELVTVMGGPHVSFDAENILLRNRQVDYIVRGEGEITFTELLGRLNEGKAADGVAGVSYRANGGVTHAPDRPLIPDINILPQPARHLVSLSKYRALGFPINMVTSRGCPNKCIFCVGSRMVGRKVRHFDVERVVDEFETLSKMKFFQINVVDDLFTTNKKRCMAICDEIIRRGIKHRWVAFARVDTVSRDLLVRMKEAGCTTLCFGVESGNQEILDAVKKNITLEKAREAVALCNEVGMEPMTSYILGLPGDSYETVKRTMQFARNLSPMYGFHILAPFPGTEVREKASEYGITILTDDWDLYDANQSVSGTGLIPPEEIDRLVRDFNSGINRYVTSLGQKKQRGETLPEKDENIIRGIVSFDFTQKLLLGEFVERYPGMRNGAAGDGLTRDFVQYLQAGLDFPPDQVSHEVDRLFNLGCLTIEEAGGRCTVIWA